MADFLEVMGPGPNKVIIGIERITSIRATTSGCVIKLIDGDSITTKHLYKDIRESLKESYNSMSQIYSIVDDKLPDATPPPPITVG